MTDTLIETPEIRKLSNLTAEDNLSEIFYAPAKTIAELADFLPEEYYIRGTVQSVGSDEISALKDALTIRLEDSVLVKVISPLIVATIAGHDYFLDGNTRVRALIEMQAVALSDSYHYADVPYRRLLIEPTVADLTRFQVVSNDTTNSHSVLQKARAAVKAWDTFKTEFESQGFTEKNAAGKATEAVADLFNCSQAYVSNLKSLATAPEWLAEKVDQGIISADVAVSMLRFENTSGMPVKAIWNGLIQLANEKDGKITKGVFNTYAKQVGSTKVVESEDGTQTEESVIEATATGKPKKLVEPAVAIEGIENTLVRLYDTSFEVSDDDWTDEELALQAKTVHNTSKVLSNVLVSQVMDVSKSIEILPSVAGLLIDIFDNSMFANLRELGETEQEKTENAILATKALKVAGKVIDLLIAEELIDADHLTSLFSGFQSTLMTAIDQIDLTKAYSPEELDSLYKKFVPLQKSLNALEHINEPSNDVVEISEPDDLEPILETLEASDEEFTATVE